MAEKATQSEREKMPEMPHRTNKRILLRAT